MIKSRFFSKLQICLLVCLIFALGSIHSAQAQVGQTPDLISSITRVAKAAIPAVVHVEITEKTEVSNPLLPFENDPLLRRFFNIPKMPKKFQKEMIGIGTGYFIDSRRLYPHEQPRRRQSNQNSGDACGRQGIHCQADR